ncbi:MAG: GNAT family N-acetyltransferase, partial [Methylocystis sp.]|nr:GNAT family N-acetyltransferase [Methylocystis sp.]
GGRFSAMLNSFDMDPAIARASPGELLLHALMRDLVSRGMTYFDLGAGEARYKQTVCGDRIALCSATLGVTRKGMVAAAALSTYLRAKRLLKRSPLLMRLATFARRMKRGAPA